MPPKSAMRVVFNTIVAPRQGSGTNRPPRSTPRRPIPRCRRDRHHRRRRRTRPGDSLRWSMLSRDGSAVEGPESACCTHSLPSHSHVLFSRVVEAPPKRTIRWRSLSKAMACLERPAGPEPATCVQFLPSHSHVSPSGPATTVPPNRTARRRTRVVRHRMKRARGGTDSLHLRPVLAVPLPGVAEQDAVERGAPEEDDALARHVEGHRVSGARSRADVLLLGPEHFCHGASMSRLTRPCACGNEGLDRR